MELLPDRDSISIQRLKVLLTRFISWIVLSQPEHSCGVAPPSQSREWTCGQQEQHDTLLNMVQKKFPELFALAKQQTDGIKDTKVLQVIMPGLAVTQSSEVAKRVLHEANKP